MNADVQKYWNEFLILNPAILKDTPFQAWFFGNTAEMALELAQLVIESKKFATASLVAVNDLKPEEAPIPDGYSVVTDFHGVPLCVIQTVEIKHLPFEEVDAQFAADEGEGDQSLEYWRDVHWRYFTREAAELSIDFNKRSLVCCERFLLLYPNPK
ncbi:MAG: ASCH domain-containing protein [Chloracidobacterium sp.]|nr:ASCH domain-containing protein [Chloracidobacterium sp.]